MTRKRIACALFVVLLIAGNFGPAVAEDEDFAFLDGTTWNALTFGQQAAYVRGHLDGARMGAMAHSAAFLEMYGKLSVTELALRLRAFYRLPANAPVGLPFALYAIDADFKGSLVKEDREGVLEYMRNQPHLSLLETFSVLDKVDLTNAHEMPPTPAHDSR